MKNNNSYEDKLNAIVKLESYIFEYIDFFASVLLNELDGFHFIGH